MALACRLPPGHRRLTTYMREVVANRNKGYSGLTLYYQTYPYNVLKGSALPQAMPETIRTIR